MWFYATIVGQEGCWFIQTTSCTALTVPILYSQQPGSAYGAQTAANMAANAFYHRQAAVRPADDLDRRFLESQAARQSAQLKQHDIEARKRANDWLLEHLTPEQRKTFETNGWFVVEGGKSKRQYRIRGDRAVAANIEVLEGDRVAHRLCAHNDIAEYPLGDHLLAQKLMLESDEDEFLKVANRHAA